MHDILTGSTPDGRAVADDKDTTCSNWTSSGDGAAPSSATTTASACDDSAPAKSWNSSHPSRGCSQDALQDDRRRRPVLLLRREVRR